MKHEKTFDAIGKLKDIELELHRLKNALEMANKGLDAQRQWVGLTDEDIEATWSQLYCDMNQMKFAPEDRPQKETVGFLFARALETKLKGKNT